MKAVRTAELVLKSGSGKSLLDGSAHIDSECIKDFIPDDSAVQEAAEALRKMGFVIVAESPTMTIQGTEEQFLRWFGMAKDDTLQVPAPLRAIVEAAFFPPEVDYYCQEFS